METKWINTHLTMSSQEGDNFQELLDEAEKRTLSTQFCLMLIKRLRGQYALMANLMLSCGMQPRECLSLRIKHIDFEAYKITIPGRSGIATRNVFIPIQLNAELKLHIEDLYQLHQQELDDGFGYVELPTSFDVSGRLSNEFSWQWLFSQRSLTLDEGVLDREPAILMALSERLSRALKGLATSQQSHITIDIFWRCYLAGA